MAKSPHVPATIITLAGVILFMAARYFLPDSMSFGLRTYWPVFIVLYLVIWYFRVVMSKSVK